MAYTTKQVARRANIHRDTLLRWLREGRIAEPKRNRNGWRIFEEQDVQQVLSYIGAESNGVAIKEAAATYTTVPYRDSATRLREMDWDFYGAKTNFLTHQLHPYACKFIPQIPNTLIQELSSVGDTVLDPFCGSGTTLVEALRLGRCVIGIDANPLACLISEAKSSFISESDAETLLKLADQIASYIDLGSSRQLSLLPTNTPNTPVAIPTNRGIVEWFEPFVIEELTVIREQCSQLTVPKLRRIALTAFSSIIVGVSRQDSETRYVRREKNITEGDTYRRFSRALYQAVERLVDFSAETNPTYTAQLIHDNILNQPQIRPVDLVVCSPPYPNAFSYHLYHRTRMEWLGMDQPTFKQDEIGSHRKYSRKGSNAATAETFRGELKTILTWLSRHLKPHRHACFVIGDSTIKGEKVRNAEMLIEVASELGFSAEANIIRQLQATKKSFNPKIGNIRNEHIVILRNGDGNAA